MTSAPIRGAWLAALTSTALSGIAVPAFAQDSAEQSAETLNPNEIIVSARRRSETLQDTPVAITAINSAMLENKASVNIGDLQGAAPNLLITQQNSGAQAANLSIRGLTYADIEKSQEPTVGVVIDGVFIGTNTGQLLDFFDIEQIEVLRGPQGTLFGRNTIGGVINIRRTKPTKEFGIKAEASYSKWNTWSTRAVVNAGDGENFGVKAWYFHNQSDGYYRNGVTGKRVGGSNNENFGASFLFEPTGGPFSAQLTVEKLDQKFDPVNSNIAQTGELFCAFEPAEQCNRNNTSDLYTVFNSPAISTYSAPAATLELNYDAGAVQITSITGWRKSKEFQTQDFDASTTDLYYVKRTQHYRQWSQELRFAGNLFDGFDYVVGGFYFNSKYDLTQFTRVFGFDTTIDPEVFDPNGQVVNGKTESYAAFGDFNWAFADKWRLSFGGRFTHDHKELSNQFLVSGPVGDGSGSFKKFTPKVGIDFRPNPDTMLYASWSRGYRSGGFSPRAATAETAGTPYNPEQVDSFEIGAKLDLLDNMLQFNVAAFYSKYDDLQQNTTIPGGPTGNQTITSNAGSAKIKGIEADLTLRPVEGLRLTATMGLLDSQFKDFIVGNVSPTSGNIVLFDYSKNNMIYAPKFSGSLGAEYTLLTGFGDVVGNVGLRHISPYDQQISLGPLTGDLDNGPVIVNGNDPRVRVKSQDLLDASLTAHFDLAGGEAYATVFGRNLLDQRRSNAAFTVAGLWSFASAIEPRTFGVTLGIKY
ncbi:TonB-dependent receptor [Novosphingobium endophyticum]|uniref:TonB-dependent receptor n=1 Tax=Novosphingobium endophyticum TaxID=1955250 RepID=A0A916X5R7_9SPHN|nr:TonB-dependent receptor [Novosphingobium endophyticum]GGC02762.1 TonB-dependent receptor [Novosphingobium endophyticum]